MIVKTSLILFLLGMVIWPIPSAHLLQLRQSIPTKVYHSWNDSILQVHFKAMPIREVAQTLSQTYGMNLLVEEGVEAHISLNLDRIGLIDGLKAMAKVHKLELSWENGVFYLRPTAEKVHQRIGVAKRLAPMDLDVSNQEVQGFIRDFGKKTGIQVLASKEIEGKISGYWKQQDPLSAFRSLMDAHGYHLKRSGEFWIVFAAEDTQDTKTKRALASRGSGQMDVIFSNEKLSLNLQEVSLKDVLRKIAEEASLNMIFYGDVNERINARIEKASIYETFASLLRGTRYTYQIADDGIILVGLKDPKSPAGKILTTYEIYPLHHIKADEVMKILPHSISQGEVIVIKEQNAILMTGTLSEIQNIKGYLKIVDAPAPQVLLEVILVEYSRGNDMEYGVKLGDNASSVNQSPELGIKFAQDGKKWVGRNVQLESSVGVLPNDFILRLTALESENKAKVLAMPRITTINGNQASIKVTNTSYYQVSSVSPDGLPINDFRPINDGITLDITPFITQAGEITVDIKPEIKTSKLTSSSGPSDISTRNLSTTLKLADGETIMLGGLIQNNKAKVREAVPILGSIPYLGYFFSYYKDIETTTELVVFVTPKILKGQEMSLDKSLELVETRELNGSLFEKATQMEMYEPKINTVQTVESIQTIPSQEKK